MSLWRGRVPRWDPDARAIEDERQRWVMERITDDNQMIADLSVDPERAYEAHRAAFIATGDPLQLLLMLEYVTTEGASS